MKKILLACFFFTASVWAGTFEQAFQHMLTLEGTWEGTYEGQTIRLSYEPISGNSALMERMTFVSDGSNMTTIYHPQGDRLMATHYCKAKNQPRLVSVSDENSDTLSFQFLDGAKQGEMHVSGLELRFVTTNQLEQTVRFQGESKPIRVLYTRKK